MIIENNLASLKKIKASEEALRALSDIKYKKTLPSFFLSMRHVYNIIGNESMMIVNFVAQLMSAEAPSQSTGAHKWNSQTQA